MHFEVDVIVQHPLDERSRRFLTDVQNSANRVVRFRGDERSITVTVEAHAYDRDGAVRVGHRRGGSDLSRGQVRADRRTAPDIVTEVKEEGA